jgi:CheY-like chemotaxis protein
MSNVPRVLVVEDQYFVAIDCELNLRSGGYECVGLATTAKEAVELAGRMRPDLVLMDIRLASAADGVDAAIVIFERFGIRSIFASAHADARIRASAERAHPLGWLEKPYSSGALLEAVQEGLQKLETQRGAARSEEAGLALH